jgi:Domain of unknown function (DUF6268)
MNSCRYFFISFFFFVICSFTYAQTEILSQSNYHSGITDNSAISVLLGKNFQNESSLILRIQSEKLWVNDEGYKHQCFSASTTVGFQFPLRNKKMKLAFMAAPKWNGSSNGIESIHDWQMGGLTMLTVQQSDRFTWRIGLFVNKEYFGYMFVPLIGFDWKTENNWRLIGLAPNSLRFGKYSNNEKWFGGVYGRSLTRTFRALDVNHYIRYNELQAGLFTERVFGKNHAVLAYVGNQFGASPSLYSELNRNEVLERPGLRTTKNYVIFGLGYSFRM